MEVAPAGSITFSELPVGSSVGSQYRMRGIAFSGDSPYITTDRSNPTSPVLSGRPTFQGEIVGSFVRPETGSLRTVATFSLDVGYIDSPGSVKVIVYGSSGNRLGQLSADRVGINRLTWTSAPAASFRVKALSGEPQGFAIDNVSFPGSARRVLVALGDSFSSGEGNEPFDSVASDCHRSNQAWPRILAPSSQVTVNMLACSGAKISALHTSYRGQEAQLRSLNNTSNVGVVTITMGGNDVGFERVLRHCYLSDCLADGTLYQAIGDIDDLARRLVAEYQTVQAASRAARVVVVGYPRLFPSSFGSVVRCPWLAPTERIVLNRLGRFLDEILSAKASAAGVEYVSVFSALAGHELCTGDSWVYALGPFGGPLRGHPLAPGQRAIAGIVREHLDL